MSEIVGPGKFDVAGERGHRVGVLKIEVPSAVRRSAHASSKVVANSASLLPKYDRASACSCGRALRSHRRALRPVLSREFGLGRGRMRLRSPPDCGA